MARPEQPRAKLGWVLDGEFIYELHAGPNRLAADALVAHYRELGRVEPGDEAHMTAAVLLGEAVDADPTNAALWGQYRAALDTAKGVGASGDDDAFAQLLAELGAADLRDAAEPEPADARRADRARGKNARPPVDAPSAADRRRRR